MSLNNYKVINANGSPLTTDLIIMALVKAGLCWHMHVAQVISLESQAFKEVHTINSQAVLQELSLHETKRTLYGIPVVINNSLPKGDALLCIGGVIIFKIEALAYPAGLDSF